ncbi:MAG: ABC transporter ATP-binding protein [Bacteroidota bacterium]
MSILFVKVFRLLVPFLWKDRTSRLATITTLVVILANTLVYTAAPWLWGYLLKHYEAFSLTDNLLTVALIVLCWNACMTLPHLIEVFFFPVINQATRDIRLRVVTNLHQVPIQTWEHYTQPEVISATTRVSQSVRDFMGASFVQIFPTLITFATSSLALLHLNRNTWYFPPLILLTYGYVYGSIRRFLQSRRQVWKITDEVHTAMNDSLQSTKFAQFHLATETHRLAKLFDKEAREWWRNNFWQYWIHLVQDTLFFLVAGGLVVHMVLLLRAGTLSVADFVAIKGYTWMMHHKMRRITRQTRTLLASLIDLEKVLELLALPTRTTDTSLPWTPATSTTPILQLRNVSFAYHQQSTPVLQNISLTIRPGEHLAIVGASGVGKSTLSHVLAGLYTPQQGEVLLYGKPMEQLSLTDIGRYVHFADQEANLINGTIADNLMTDLPTAQTMPLAYLNDRLDEATGDGGKKLSGGEKQRILLARCLSYQPEVLILDETLSALDETSAQELLQLVLKTVPTVILVTHRESLIKGFEHIYRLEAGQRQAA